MPTDDGMHADIHRRLSAVERAIERMAELMSELAAGKQRFQAIEGRLDSIESAERRCADEVFAEVRAIRDDVFSEAKPMSITSRLRAVEDVSRDVRRLFWAIMAGLSPMIGWSTLRLWQFLVTGKMP